MVMMRILDVLPRKIVFRPVGIQIYKNEALFSYKKDFFTAVSGLLVNAVMAAFFCSVYYYTHSLHCALFGIINIFVFAFNAIPIKGLDGYDILKSAAERYMADNYAKAILKGVSVFFTAVLFICLGAFFYTNSMNISAAATGIYFVLMMIINFRD